MRTLFLVYRFTFFKEPPLFTGVHSVNNCLLWFFLHKVLIFNFC